jgi:hypothetical protein
MSGADPTARLAEASPVSPVDAVALACLAVFVAAAAIGGMLIAPAVGCFTLAGSVLVVALILGLRQ